MLTALYDGHCVICQSTRRIFKALDWRNRIEFLDLHEAPQVITRFPDLEYDELMGEIHVVDDNKRVYGGFDATCRMLRELPLGFPVWLLLHLPGMRWVGVRVYRWIATHRYAVNRFFGVELPEEDCGDGYCKLPE